MYLYKGLGPRKHLETMQCVCVFVRPGAPPPGGQAKHVKRMPKKHRRRRRASSLRGGGGGVAGLLRLTSNLLTSESSGASSAPGGGDYDEQADVVRFLEDGSFIGQYGGPKRDPTASGSEEALPIVTGATSVSATALSTFV